MVPQRSEYLSWYKYFCCTNYTNASHTEVHRPGCGRLHAVFMLLRSLLAAGIIAQRFSNGNGRMVLMHCGMNKLLARKMSQREGKSDSHVGGKH